MLAVFVGELIGSCGEMAQIVDRRHQCSAQGRVPLGRSAEQRLGDSRDQATELSQGRNRELGDRVAGSTRRGREVSWCGTGADVVEDNGTKPVELRERLFGEGHGGRN